jgi:hypothetical protein
MDDQAALYLEQNILSTFLLIGLWGSVTLFLDHYVKRFGEKLLTYILFVIVSFTLLHARNHIHKEKSFR